MITIRTPSPADRPAILDLVALAFDTPWPREAQVLAAIADDPDYAPEQAVVAYDDDGRLVGHATAKITTVSLGEVQLVVGRLGTVCTHPELRRQGLGRAIVEAAARRVEQAGAVILNPAHDAYVQRFYESMAFVPAMRSTPIRELDPSTVTRRVGPAVRLAEPADVPALERLYQQHYGPQPGSLGRTTAWWQARVAQRAMLWSQVTPRVWVADGAAGPVAYLMEAPDWHLQVWEWAAEPGCDDAAGELLAEVAQRCDETLQVAITAQDPLSPLLDDYGGTEVGEPPRPVMLRAAETALLLPVLQELLALRGAVTESLGPLVQVRVDGARLTCDWSHLLGLAYDGRSLPNWLDEGRVTLNTRSEAAVQALQAVLPARAAGRRLTDAY